MDEPMTNPLQLVKELVLLIVEARTPDLSVKGRVEGPHCPVLRGRPAHKCSADKSECVRASDFCYLAQRLWMNSIPICLDILLFPDCLHGQEAAALTEGTVTTLSQENALLIERWTIDGNKRRQDYLPSSMLIQAVRSYLHFSQISSWLYSTGGKLPGLLAYRVYAPGEVTSLNFLQTPDIHSFPVCLANFHHIRVSVSSLQRQASVPVLVCHQNQTLENNSRESLLRNDRTQKHRSGGVAVKIGYEHMQDRTLSEGYFMGSLCASEISTKTDPSTAGHCTLAKKIRSSKKSIKSLQEVSAQALSEDEIYQYCPSAALTNLFPSDGFSETGHAYHSFDETDNRQTLSASNILARKARNRARMKTGDGGDNSHDVLYATSCHAASDLTYDDETVEASLFVNMNPALGEAMFTHDLPGRRIKSADLKMNHRLMNRVAGQRNSLKNKPPFSDISQKDKDRGCNKLGCEKKINVRKLKRDGKNDFYIEQINTGVNMDTREIKTGKLIGEEEEYRQTNKEVDVQTLIRKKKKAEFSKFKKSLIEVQPDLKANLEMWWPLQVEGMKELSLNNAIYNSVGKKLPFVSLSPREKCHDGNSNDNWNTSAFNTCTGSESKMLARKKSSISQEASEEELIRILSDRLSVINTPQIESFASPKFSAKFNDTEAVIDKNIRFNNLSHKEISSQPRKKQPHSRVTQDDKETAGLEDGREEETVRCVNTHLVEDSKLSQLTINVSGSPEDSDDTPVASPNQSRQRKSVPEFLIKSVADPMHQSCHKLHNSLSKLLYDDTSQEEIKSSNVFESGFTVAKDSNLFAHETSKRQELDDTALIKKQSVNKCISETQGISASGLKLQLVKTFNDQMQAADKETVCQPLNVFPQNPIEGNTDTQNGVIRFEQTLCRTSLENNYCQFSDVEKCCKESDYANEDPLSEEIFSCDHSVPQPGSRRIFEENLLPLVSYDADSDSFKKVEELYSSNVLHSPKVLFSCDVPSMKMANSRKCINFGDFETEFFRSKISDMVDPEAIAKYMSSLAILSSSSTNGRYDQDDDAFVCTIKEGNDLSRHNIPSNLIEMSSREDCLLKQRRVVQDAQTNSDIVDLESEQNYCLIKTEKDNDQVMKEKSDKGEQVNPDATVNEFFDENLEICHEEEDSFNKTRRQLNLSYFENTEPSDIRKTTEYEGLTSASVDIGLSALSHDSVLEKKEYQEKTLPVIINSKDISVSFPSERIVTLSPLLSSSCSSSSSSTSSVRMASGSLSPTFPAALRTSFKTDKGSEGDHCILDIQEPLCSLNVTSQKYSLLQEDPNTLPLERKYNKQRNLQSNIKSKWRSSSNIESLTLELSNATFSVPSVPQSSTTSSNISAHLPLSSVLLSLPIVGDATHVNLCHNYKISPTSLSKVIIPQPLPQDDTDFNNRLIFNFKPEPQHDLQQNLLDQLCDQTVPVYDHQDSQTETPHFVPKLFKDQPQVKQLYDTESTSCDQADRHSTVRKGNVSTRNRPVEGSDTNKEVFSYAQASVDTFAITGTIAAQPTQENPLIISAIAKPTLDSFQNKSPPKTDGMETCDKQLSFSCRDFNFEDHPRLCSSFNTVIHAQTVISNRFTEPWLETPHTVSIGNNHSSKNKKSSICEYNSVASVPKVDSESSCNKYDITVSLGNVALKDGITNEAANLSEKTVVCEDSRILQVQSDFHLEVKENCSPLFLNSESRTGSQNEQGFEKICPMSLLQQSASSCNFSADLQTTEASDVEKSLDRDQCIVVQNGFNVEGEDPGSENDFGASNWSNDVVFYISEPDCKMKAGPTTSLLSNSLNKNVTPSENCKSTRPSSLSAEVNLEMKLRSNPGIKNTSNLDFTGHSRSPPFHNDPPGWSSVPPHRTVSTPSCMDRETTSKEEKSSSNISVIQQQNCDNVSQTGLLRMAAKSASMIFNNRTGLPTQSSPAPLKRKSGGRFDYDVNLLNTRAIKNAFSCSKLASNIDGGDNEEEKRRTLSTSAPASTNCLLGNFEESILNGRIDPVGTVDGFTAEIGASGTFCPKHLHLPVSAFFFALSDDNAPSPYLGHINLESVGKKGYHIPKKGTVQVTLFNPNKTVVKMFVVVYDLSDMPASSQTFIRQRTVYSPIDKNHTAPSYLRYLIHLRCASSQSGKVYLHTDIRLIFARHKLDIDAKTIPYELKSYTEGPQNPKYSPKK